MEISAESKAQAITTGKNMDELNLDIFRNIVLERAQRVQTNEAAALEAYINSAVSEALKQRKTQEGDAVKYWTDPESRRKLLLSLRIELDIELETIWATREFIFCLFRDLLEDDEKYNYYREDVRILREIQRFFFSRDSQITYEEEYKENSESSTSQITQKLEKFLPYLKNRSLLHYFVTKTILLTRVITKIRAGEDWVKDGKRFFEGGYEKYRGNAKFSTSQITQGLEEFLPHIKNPLLHKFVTRIITRIRTGGDWRKDAKELLEEEIEKKYQINEEVWQTFSAVRKRIMEYVNVLIDNAIAERNREARVKNNDKQ